MSKFNPRPPRCPSAPVLTQSRGGSTYAPAGGVAGQRRFMLHGFRAGSRFDVDTGLGWDDVTEGDGSGPVPGGWLTRTANLPATPFRIRVRLADGTYLQWDRVDPAAGDPIHINVDATGPDPVIPWTVGSEGNASGARSFQLALERIPPGTRVAVLPNGGDSYQDITEPGEWLGSAWITAAHAIATPFDLRLAYPDGTSRVLANLNPDTDPAFVADPSRFVLNAAPGGVVPIREVGEFGTLIRTVTISGFSGEHPVIRVTGADLGDPVWPAVVPGELRLPILFRGAPGRVTLDIGATRQRGAVRQTVDLTTGNAGVRYTDMPLVSSVSIGMGGASPSPVVSAGGSAPVLPTSTRFRAVGSGATGITGDTPYTVVGAGGASGMRTLRIWHIPEGARVFLNDVDVTASGQWEAPGPASQFFAVPASLAANSLRVVAPNGEQRRTPVVPSTAQPTVTVDYLTMPVAIAAGSATGRVQIAGIPQGSMLKVDGADVTTLPASRWVDAAQTIYGVPSPLGGHSIAVRAPNGEERVSTFTLVDAATPVQLNYTDMRVTREADAMTTTGGMGSIVVSGVPAAIMADSVTAIHSTPAGDIGAQFAPHQFMPGAFVAQNVAAGDWRVSVMVRGALVGRPGSGYGVGPDIRSATVTVRPNETVQVNFASMTAPTGIPVTDPNDRGMVVAGSVPLTITAPDTFLVTVDGATVSPNLIQSSGNPGLIDGRYVAPTGAFTQRQAMVAPGVHRVAVRDPSAAACYSDTQDITVASGVPASMDYTAPITSALQACAARQSVATGGWAGLSAPAKMGVVGVGLAAVGGAIWWWADSAKSSRSSRDDSDEE